MTKQELIKALDSGLDVRWSNDSYKCFKDVTGIYSVICTSNDSMIGIFSKDMQRFRKNWVGTSLQPEVEKLLIEAAGTERV